MATESERRFGMPGLAAADAAVMDQELRAYMLRVYNYMASGLALSGIVAFATAQSPAMMQAIFGSGLFWIVALAPLGLLLVMSFGLNKMSAPAIQALYWAFTALMGVSLASIFVVYTGASIARVFFITAGTFGAMSLYGYTTKRDLTAFGSFLMMGLIGIIIASVVNMFLQSAMLQWVVSVIGVLVFVGLTAYDTQKIKSEFIAYRMQGAAAVKSSIMGAVRLYLDFLNLFLMLLRLFGNRN